MTLLGAGSRPSVRSQQTMNAPGTRTGEVPYDKMAAHPDPQVLARRNIEGGELDLPLDYGCRTANRLLGARLLAP